MRRSDAGAVVSERRIDDWRGPFARGKWGTIQLKLVSAAQVRAKHCAKVQLRPERRPSTPVRSTSRGFEDFLRRVSLWIMKILVIGSTRPQGR